MIETPYFAKMFHEAYERLAPSFGYETRRDSAVPWDQVPEKNQRLMEAVCSEVVMPLYDAALRVVLFASQSGYDKAVAQRVIEELATALRYEKSTSAQEAK